MEQGENEVYYAPWEKRFGKLISPLEEFIHGETTSGILLMICTVVALLMANTALVHIYEHTLHTHLIISIGPWSLDYTLHHWINDGLMALFFFLVGLEIKREILVGELADPRQAALPIIAAIGGMAVPALIYYALNPTGPGAAGWGIPMATDIAFAVGVLVLLGDRIPKTVLTFLLALAIVDDLGAVLVIAFFYTEQIFLDALAIATVLLGALIILNLSGVRKPAPYLLVGGLLWLAMLKSGVHATLAGVLTAFCIPAKPKFNPQGFSNYVRDLMDRYDKNWTPSPSLMQNINLRAIVQTLESGVHKVETPLQRLEHNLHVPVFFFIIPLFALANAGVPIQFGELGGALTQPVALGIILGLLVGKLVGVAGVSLLAIKLGLAQLPAGATPKHVIGAGLLAGIGFTMSIFIAELGFRNEPEILNLAKTGILFASLVTGMLGYLWLYFTTRPQRGGAE